MKELARIEATGKRILDASHTDAFDARAAQKQMSLEMLRLEYQHRQAYTKLKATMGQ